MFDVFIIGAGVVGTMIARELSRYDVKVCLTEKESDVAMGASGANSGIVHAGYDPEPGSLKARFNVEGNALFPQLCRELQVPYRNNGSLVLAFDSDETRELEHLLENGKKNGVPALSILSNGRVRAMEPDLSPEVQCALYAPSAGIVSPYELTIAAAENAVQNGVLLRLNESVLGIAKRDGLFLVTTQNGVYTARFLINAAGLYADAVSAMAGAECYEITPRKGEYILFDKTAAKPDKVIFQAPSRLGKGVLVTPTAHGNLMIGPSATDGADKSDTSVTAEGLSHISELAKKSFPHINPKEAITEFAGLRAISGSRDFIVTASRLQKGFIHVAGICSPGLTASPAIAKYVCGLLAEAGLELRPKDDFQPVRRRIPCFAESSVSKRNRLIRQNPLYGKIVCRCEQVTEAEIIESIRRGATTLDAVKRRVRAGMGRCQGGFCSSAVLKILARELSLLPEQVTKNGEGSNILTGYTK